MMLFRKRPGTLSYRLYLLCLGLEDYASYSVGRIERISFAPPHVSNLLGMTVASFSSPHNHFIHCMPAYVHVSTYDHRHNGVVTVTLFDIQVQH